jgi:mRNA interferase YafQ
MLQHSFTKTFRKQLKLMGKRGLNLDKLREVTDMIINEQPLLPKHEDHPLHGNYKGKRECHVEPDWVLVYRIDKDNREVVFYRTGSHSDLF